MNTSGWKPTGHRVLVKVEKIEEVSQGGIIIPKDVAKREQLGQDGGVVVELGNTAYSDQSEAWCKEGDYVKFGKYAGQLIMPDESADGIEYRVLNDLDVCLVKQGDSK